MKGLFDAAWPGAGTMGNLQAVPAAREPQPVHSSLSKMVMRKASVFLSISGSSAKK